MKRYRLRVMVPGTIDRIAEEVLSETPFAISVGDLVNLEAYSQATGLPGLFDVIRIEHQWTETKSAGTLHSTIVYTADVPDTAGSRIGNRQVAPHPAVGEPRYQQVGGSPDEVVDARRR